MIQQVQKKVTFSFKAGHGDQIFSCTHKELSRKILILFQITTALSRSSDLNYYSFKNTPLPKQATDTNKISDIPPQSDQKIEEIYGTKVASLSIFEVSIVIRSFQ